MYSVAPGEDKQPLSFFSDKQSEELAFPVLFPKGRFGYMAEHEVKLSVGKYFNARLLHYSGRFASNAEYLIRNALHFQISTTIALYCRPLANLKKKIFSYYVFVFLRSLSK